MTGNKREEKRYYRHSGYPGGLRSRTLDGDARAPPGGGHPQGRQGHAAPQPARPRAAAQAQGLRRARIIRTPPRSPSRWRCTPDARGTRRRGPGAGGERTPAAEEAGARGRGRREPGEALAEAGAEPEEPEAEEPAAEEPAEAEEPAAEEPDGRQLPPEEPAAPRRRSAEASADADAEPAAEGRGRGRRGERAPARAARSASARQRPEEEVIPGAHLEPDLVLEEEQRAAERVRRVRRRPTTPPRSRRRGAADGAPAPSPSPWPTSRSTLAADARYAATGKRKSAVARVILKPGEGTYTVNGRHLDEYFPRVRLQRMARQPLEAAGYQNRMDVVARIHGGGVSAQATALRHGIARALVEADPALRGELKRRGYLTRDPRVKERKKAGLKKARKRPQFSKR